MSLRKSASHVMSGIHKLIQTPLHSAITDSPANIHKAENIALLCVAAVMIPAFLGWMSWREKVGKPALIPNSLWQNTAFSSICVMVLFSWAVLNGMETILSLL